MGLLTWFERKLFTGEVLRDFGVLQERAAGITRMRTSILLCRRSGALQLVFRQAATAPLGAGVQYIPIDVSPEALDILQAALDDARRMLTPDVSGPVAPPGADRPA